jgi:anti-sigma factor ChrR (cupin superfamily)
MLNLDFSQRLVVETNKSEWLPSPSGSVFRIPFERAAPESGHATSLVRYEAGASFESHSHPMGEEIFVVEGVFSDETGDYPAGTYLRNPPGSAHSPFSKDGCLLFVKLNQFHPEDSSLIIINTNDPDGWRPGHGGLRVFPLHSFQTEGTALVWWPAGERFLPHRHYGGEEIFVLSGVFQDEHGEYPKGTWLRSPHLSVHHPFVSEDTLILVKTGHLGLT